MTERLVRLERGVALVTSRSSLGVDFPAIALRSLSRPICTEGAGKPGYFGSSFPTGGRFGHCGPVSSLPMFGHCGPSSGTETLGHCGPVSRSASRPAEYEGVTGTLRAAMSARARPFQVRVTTLSFRRRVKFEANCFQLVSCKTSQTDRAQRSVNGRIKCESACLGFVIRARRERRFHGASAIPRTTRELEPAIRRDTPG